MALPDRALEVLETLLQAGLGQRPLILICHSLGGLLAKQVLRKADDADETTEARKNQLAACTRAVLFIATPHAGAALATVANAFRAVFGPTVSIEELRAHDAHLRDLYDWYRKRSVALGVTTRTYYENQGVKGFLPIVNPTSAHPGVGIDPISLDADHLSIAKPLGRDALVFGTARELIREHVLTQSPGPHSVPGPAVPQNAYDNATSSALDLIGPAEDAQLRVRYVETRGELHALWQIDDEAYERASIPYDTFERWWAAYPPGLKGLFAGSDVMGAIGIWPLSKTWAASFCTGTVKEHDLPIETLRRFRSRAADHWYISGIVLKQHLRGTEAVKTLLSEGLWLWAKREECRFPAEVLALAYSKKGEELLRRFAFSLFLSSGQTADGIPMYRRRFASRDDVIRALASRKLLDDADE